MAAPEPVAVPYCPHCTFPPDMCAYGPCYETCKTWLAVHHPGLLPAAAGAGAGAAATTGAGAGTSAASAGAVAAGGTAATDAGAAAPVAPADAAAAALAGLSLAPAGAGAEAGAAPAAAAKAGKAVSFGVKGKKGAATAVTVSRKERGRGKCVTIIRGLETFDVKLKDAASALGKKYGTGGSVTKDAAGALEVTIQGDFADDMPEVLETLYKVPQEAVHVMSS